jgi:hypothetical protein
MNHRARHFIGTVLFLVFLQPGFLQTARAQDESSPLVVIDLRPDSEREGMGLTALTGKCNKDVFRIADVATDPLKVDVLKQDLSRSVAVGEGSSTLTVLNWSVYYNKQIHKGGGGFLKNIGVQGYDMPASKSEGKQPGSNCSQKESAGGWYEGKEVTGIYFPIVSEFTGTYRGKPLNVRVVYSPGKKIEGKFEGGANDTAALLEAVHKTAEDIAIAMATQ